MRLRPPAAPAGIVCPVCSGTDWRTRYARRMDGHIERRRECKQCGLRVTTEERRKVTSKLPNESLDPATLRPKVVGGYCQYQDA